MGLNQSPTINNEKKKQKEQNNQKVSDYSAISQYSRKKNFLVEDELCDSVQISECNLVQELFRMIWVLYPVVVQGL